MIGKLLLFILLSLIAIAWERFNYGQSWEVVLAGVGALFLGIFLPVVAYPLFGAIAVWLFVQWLKDRRQTKERERRRATVTLP